MRTRAISAAMARKSSAFVVSRKDVRDSGSASNPSKAPQIAQAIAPIVSVSPPMLAHMIAARSALRQ